MLFIMEKQQGDSGKQGNLALLIAALAAPCSEDGEIQPGFVLGWECCVYYQWHFRNALSEVTEVALPTRQQRRS